MNELLAHYQVDVEFPDVSGAELLEMLQIRDKLAKLEPTLSPAEQEILTKADHQLIRQAPVFYNSLSTFINFPERRKSQQISVKHWWWYLDVLAQLPHPEQTEYHHEPAMPA